MRSRFVATLALAFAQIVHASLANAQSSPSTPPVSNSRHPFVIEVVDEETGRGVPLVELKTVHHVAYWTDSAGIVVIDEPDLMGQRVYFTIRSHGYEVKADGFGFRGHAFNVKPDGSAKLAIKRINLAERLYRITGAGIYRDSLIAGRATPNVGPSLNSQVTGQDTVFVTEFGGRLFWIWGDTNRIGYPLGNYQTTGATSALPGAGGLDPAVGIRFDYVQAANGFTKQLAPMTGSGPTWLHSLFVVSDAKGTEHLLAGYVKIKNDLEIYRRGLAEWDAKERVFKHLVEFPLDSPVGPEGHHFRLRSGERDDLYFAHPFPAVRVPATYEAVQDLSRYEAFTLLKKDTKRDEAALDRAADGQPIQEWKTHAPILDCDQQAKLLRSGAIKPEQDRLLLRDVATGRPIRAHRGSVSWNEYRKRWIMVVTESHGTSLLGEVWFAEADSPTGPWGFARKILTHDRYSFYNPRQHPNFDQDGGRLIYFEGTYTHTFSGNPVPTPRYDYNQIMYRLDLSKPELTLPVAFYRSPRLESTNAIAAWQGVRSTPGEFAAAQPEPRFWAFDRPVPGCVAVFWKDAAKPELGWTVDAGPTREPSSAASGSAALFYAPTMDRSPPGVDVSGTARLIEWTLPSGARTYLPAGASAPEGAVEGAALCRIWRAPLSAAAPENRPKPQR